MARDAARAHLLRGEGQPGRARSWSGWWASAPASTRRASRRWRRASPPARDPSAISYGNTVKKEGAIRAAFERGVRMFAFDSEAELRKLARSAPGARVYCRILVGNDGAEWPLSRKFGCEVEMARELMVLAGELGLDPFGLSFHVGSQQTNDRGLRGGDRQGGDAVHRPARGRREGAHGQPRRRLPGALPRRRCRRSTISAPPSWARWPSISATRCPRW